MTKHKHIPLEILHQPDDSTCGPTCLQSVYRFFGDDIALSDVIAEVEALASGGTLAVLLGRHALARGYRVTIHTYNLHLFDPTWFEEGTDGHLAARLRAQAEAKPNPKLQAITVAYEAFLAAGGRVRFDEMSPELIRGYLRRDQPILAGLSATYLYGCAREIERGDVLEYDDISGTAQGHFVMLHGYNRKTKTVRVADPLHDNPAFGVASYEASMIRVIGAILLGVITHDANLLIIEPPGALPAS